MHGLSDVGVASRFPGFYREVTGVWAPNGHPATRLRRRRGRAVYAYVWTHPEEVNEALLEFVDQRDKKLVGS
jgi:hypothetical protein